MVSSARDSAAAAAMLLMSSGDHSVAVEGQTVAARTTRAMDEMAAAGEFMVGAARVDWISYHLSVGVQC